MKIDYVLVDFENVQPKNVGLLTGGPYKIKVFVAANQAKIPLERARALQAFGPDAESHFANQIMDEELDELVEQLIERGAMKITNGKVHYELPA